MFGIFKLTGDLFNYPYNFLSPRLKCYNQSLFLIKNKIIMGAFCCQLDETQNKFRGDLYKLQAFEAAEMPEDPVVKQWIAENVSTATEEDNTKQGQKQQRSESNEKKLLKLKSNDTFYYCSWINSLADGKGFIYKPNVLFFSGSFKLGVPEGKAFVKFLNQPFIYEGDVKGWRAHGNGILTNNKSDYKISGYWENSKLKAGVINFFSDPNISNLRIDNYDSGKGNITYKDSRQYQGQLHLKKLIPHGHGKVIFPTQSSKIQYEGQWYFGQMTGQGKLSYRNLTSYQGQFFNGLKDGFGRYTYENGKYFEGMWRNGKQNGAGAQYSLLGDVIKYGIWQNNKLKKQINKVEWAQLSQISRSKHSQFVTQKKGGKIQQDPLGDSKIQPSSEISEYQIKVTQSQYG